jgi:hypothetical protein
MPMERGKSRLVFFRVRWPMGMPMIPVAGGIA